MRIFEKFPENKKCPICKTNKQEKCTLIAIFGSNEEGSLTHEAEVVHIDCLDLFIDLKTNIIYQKVVE